ncbi:MAG: Patatin [Rhizobacter sp.]|nr:Patatin [Rhizobacter sp.]
MTVIDGPGERTHPLTGLILTGGGARAAYQVGVLEAVVAIRKDCHAPPGNPFPVIAGTSAGAINAAALACGARDFDAAVSTLAAVWSQFHAAQVYRTDSLGVVRSGARWLTMMSVGWALARWFRASPKSLLDNSPLQALLQEWLRLDTLQDVMREGHLKALAIAASSYSSGTHVTFYDALAEIKPWLRSQRAAVRDRLTVGHLLASSAIPFLFPAMPLEMPDGTQYFGDGSMRQAAPISPAVHLGAERILVVGAGRMHEPADTRASTRGYPTLAAIAGHALSNIFLDALAVDVERVERVNHTLSLMTPEARIASGLRPIEVLVIAPSQRLDDLAARHVGNLPVTVRALLRSVGVSGRGPEASGAALASYLLFEAPYTQELMALGRNDTFARRDEVARFLGWDRRAVPRGEPSPQVHGPSVRE